MGNTEQGLKRVVGLRGAVFLGLGSILGTGVFVSLALGAQLAGSWLPVAVFAAGLLATANGLSSAELAASHPVSGGTYAYGRRYVSPGAGFAAGWLYLCAKSASAATAALGGASYLLHLLQVEPSPWWRVCVAELMVITVVGVALAGMRRSDGVNRWIVSLTLLSLGALCAYAAWAMGRGAVQLRWSGPRLEDLELWSLFEATALMFVAYTGYGRVATLGEEVTRPAQTIPRAVIWTLGVSMVLYVSVSAASLGVLGVTPFGQTLAGDAAPLEAVAQALDSPVLAGLVALGAITAMIGVLLNLVLGLSRVAFAMSRDGELPSPLSGVDAQGSPREAVLAIGMVIALLVASGDVRTTWTFSAVTVLLYYGLCNLCATRLQGPVKRFPPWVAYVGLVGCFGLTPCLDLWALGSAGLVLLAGAGLRWGTRLQA